MIIASSASELGAALCWAAATVFFKKRLNDAEKLSINGVQLVSGGLTLVAISLFVEKWQVKLWPAPALWSFAFLVTAGYRYSMDALAHSSGQGRSN